MRNQDPMKTHDPNDDELGPYKDPGTYKSFGPYEDSGLSEDPGTNQDPGSFKDSKFFDDSGETQEFINQVNFLDFLSHFTK